MTAVKRTIILLLFLYGVSTNAQSILLENLDIESYNSMIEFKEQLWIFGPGRKVGSTPSPYNVLKSTDEGENWQIVVPNNGTIHPYSKTVVFKGKLYSIAGHPSSVTNEVKVSSDGVNWTSYSAPFSARKTHAALVHNEKLYVIAGSGNNDVWKTDDGINWKQICSRLSSDFPHFWRPRVFSLNGKLILFGGSKTDWGFENNEKGIYISIDDGATWAKSTLPYDVDLSSSRIYFVKNNRLFIEVYTEVYGNSSIGKIANRGEKRLISTNDGTNWKLEPNRDQKILSNYSIRTKAVDYKSKIFVFQQKDNTTSLTKFEEPVITINAIEGVLKQVSEGNTTTIPITVSHTNKSFNGSFIYSVTSSDQTIVDDRKLSVENGQIKIESTGNIGETQIQLTVSDGTNEAYEQFGYFTYGNGQCYVRKLANINVDLNGTIENQYLVRFDSPSYGENQYSVTSSNESFVPSSDLSVSRILQFEKLNFEEVDTGNSGETKVTVIATDGNSSFSQSLWLKVGEDQAPVAGAALENYGFNPNQDFEYSLPDGAFSDPEGQELTFSSDDLPQGLAIHPQSGDIYGKTTQQLPFEITIKATDRYGKSVEQTLSVVKRNNVKVNVEFNFQVALYPNPCKQILNIDLGKPGTYQLFSANGMLIQIGRLKVGNNNVNLSQLSRGIYLVRMTIGGEVITKQIIKN